MSETAADRATAAARGPMAAELRRQGQALLAMADRMDGGNAATVASPSPGADLVVAERLRQIEEEGHTPETDRQHAGNELAWAAWCYLDRAANMAADNQDAPAVPTMWPLRGSEWKPKDTVQRNLVVAAALIVAELDRRLRG